MSGSGVAGGPTVAAGDETAAWLPDGAGTDALPLFLLPAAGGSAAMYEPWLDAFPPQVAACPVELPGRGRRLTAMAVEDLVTLVNRLDAACRPRGGQPWAVLGHSMGALVASVWAAAAYRAGHPPLVVYVSGAAPPWVLSTAREPAALDDERLWAYMVGLGGVPEPMRSSPLARRLLIRAMRADVTAADSWRPSGPVPTGCPIVAVAGEEDPVFPPVLVHQWRTASAAGFSARILPGAHFYRSGLTDLLPTVREDLVSRIDAHHRMTRERTST